MSWISQFGATPATRSKRVEEINPINLNGVPDNLCDLTNIAANTTAYLYVDMTGFKHIGIQGVTSGTTPTDVLTVTVEITNRDDGTAAASCTYVDVGAFYFGSASWVDTDFAVSNQIPICCKYLRIKYNTSNTGGNDADLRVDVKRVY